MHEFETDPSLVAFWCDRLKIDKDKWKLVDGKVNVEGNVYYSNVKHSMAESPIKFGRVTGNFHADLQVSSFIGFPDWVGGSFSTTGMSNIISLKGCPKEVMGAFDVQQTSIKNLQHSPDIVHGSFYASYCDLLESIRGIGEVKGALIVKGCHKFLPNILEVFDRNIHVKELVTGIDEIDSMLRQFLPKKDMLGFQDAMIEAGFEEYVEIPDDVPEIRAVKEEEEEKIDIDKFNIEMEKIEHSLDASGIENYHVYWNKEEKAFNVDVDGNVILSNTSFKKIPWKFGVITGFLLLKDNRKLESLENAPRTLSGILNCANCHNLKSLKGCPSILKDLWLIDTNITDFTDGPEEVTEHLEASNCRSLVSFKGAPKTVGSLTVEDCPELKSFEGFPEHVKNSASLKGCTNVKTTKGIRFISKTLNVSDCTNLEKLEDITHAEEIIMWSTPIKNVLYVFNIKNLKKIISSSIKVEQIVNNYLKSNDMLNCQDELIEAGFEEYAEID